MKFNIRAKLFFWFCSFFLIILLSSSIISYNNMSKNLRTMASDNLEQVTKNILSISECTTESTVKSYLRAIAEKNRALVQHFHSQFTDGKLTRDEMMARIREIFLDPQYGQIGVTGYLAGVSGTGILTIHPKSEGTDASRFAFMKKAIKQKNGYMEYFWKNKNEESERLKAGWMSYFEPLDLIVWASSYKEEFTFLLDIDDFRKHILSIRIGKEGYPFIINSKGDVIIHPSLEGQNLFHLKDENGKEFIKEMCERKNGVIRYLWKKKDSDDVSMKLVNFKYFKDMDWILASGIYEDELFKPLLKQRDRFIALIIGSMAILILVVLLLSNSFTKPIKRIVALLEETATGDLTKRLPPGPNDEIGIIMKIINEFLDTLHQMNSDIRDTTTLLNNSTEELTNVSQEIYSTSNEQAAAVAEVVATVEEFATMSTQMAKNASGVSALAEKTENDVKEGAGYVHNTLEKMKTITASNELNINEIDKLVKKVEQITEVLQFINTIADQTKLIAFNAALEASSSEGDSGRRFGIVAVEIRRLAEGVVESITGIEETINEINKATKGLMISFEESSIRINEGYFQAEETAKVLEAILKSSTSTSKSAKQIDNGVSQQKIASDQIVATLKEISKGIQQFVGATKTSDDITRQINDLSKTFNTMVSRFRLKD